MLNGLQLHGVDIEQLCRRALNAYTRRTTPLNAQDTEDALADLFEATVKLAAKYEARHDTGHNNPIRFDQYAYPLLQLRCVDWLRKDEGRTTWKFATHTHTRIRPQLLSLDAPTHHDDPLGLTLADQLSNPQTDHHPDADRRLLTTSRLHQDRDHAILRTHHDQLATARARNARRAA